MIPRLQRFLIDFRVSLKRTFGKMTRFWTGSGQQMNRSCSHNGVVYVGFPEFAEKFWTASGHQTDIKRTANGQQVNTYNKDKKVKKDKNYGE